MGRREENISRKTQAKRDNVTTTESSASYFPTPDRWKKARKDVRTTKAKCHAATQIIGPTVDHPISRYKCKSLPNPMAPSGGSCTGDSYLLLSWISGAT
jgi:hypothetical protein